MNTTIQGMKDKGLNFYVYAFGLLAFAAVEACTTHRVSGLVAYWIGWTIGTVAIPFVRYRLSLRGKKEQP